MGILISLVPVLFVSFFLGELPKIRLFDAATVGPLDIVVFIFFIIWSLKIKKSEKYFLEKPIIIFLVTAGLSLLINIFNYQQSQLFVSFLYLFRWGLYSTMYFVVRDIGRGAEKSFFNFSTITGGLLIITGILQYIFFPNLIGWYHLGWDKHLNRIFSTFLDPNFAGIILVLFFIFIFYFKDRIFKSNKKLAFVSLVLSFVSIILTYSRGAFLMLGASAFTYSLIAKNKKFFVATVISLVIVFIVLIPGFYLENNNLLRTNSVIERISTAEKGLRIFKDHPMGVGFDAYRYAREKYGDIDFELAGPSHAGAGLDNSFIFVLVTAGIVGFISYIYLLSKIFLLGFKNKVNGYGFILIVSLAGLVINSLTINSLFYSYIMLWIWILAGLTESN